LVRHLRRLIHAMGATDFLPRPEGRLPTPTMPTPAASTAAALTPPDPEPTEKQMRLIRRMREAIRISPHGRNSKAASLIRLAHIGNQPGRWALDWLEQNGEYDGFARGHAQRHKG
jgi:hypothetical protein